MLLNTITATFDAGRALVARLLTTVNFVQLDYR